MNIIKVFEFFGEIGVKTQSAEEGLRGIRDEATESANNITQTFKNVAKTIGAIFAVGKIIDFGKIAMDASATSQALNAQFEQVFGDMEEEARAGMERVAQEVGSLPNRLLPAFNQISSFAKVNGMETSEALGFTERAMVAAADTAAWYDKSIEETTDTLQSYLKGNFQVADNLGILSTETTRNAKATELFGQKYSELSGVQQQEVLLKMYEEANELSGAMGQASREADGWENVMGNLKQAWQDFLALVGAPILKAVIPIVQGITSGLVLLLDVIVPISERLSDWLAPLGSIATLFDDVDSSASGVASTFDKVRIAFESIYDLITGGSQKENTDLMKQIGISDKVVGIVLATSNGINRIRTSLDRFTTLVKTKANGVISQLSEWFEEIWTTIQEIDFEQLIENILEFVAIAIETFTDLMEFLLDFFEPIVTLWKQNVDNIITLFGGIVRAFNQAMSGDWSGAFDTLKTAIGDAFTTMGDNILEAWSGIWDNVKSFATSIDWAGVAQTVMTFLGGALSSAVEFIGDVGGVIKGWIQDKLNLDDGSTWGDIGRAILGLITTGITTAISGISNVASEIITWIFDALESTGDTDWLEVGKSILTGIFNTFSSLAQSFTEIVVALIKGINDMMTAEQFKTLVETILSSIVTAIGAITAGLVTVAVALVNGIALGLLGADNWGEVVSNISTKLNEVLTANPFEFDWMAWLNLDPSKWDWSGTLWNLIPGFEAPFQGEPNNNKRGKQGGSSQTTSSAFGMGGNSSSSRSSNSPDYATMAQEATTGMNIVNQAIRAGYEAIRTTFTQMESNMVKLMTQIMTKLQEPVKSGMTTLNQEFRQGYEPIRTTFTQMGNNLERLMTQAIKKVDTSVKTNMASVASAFRSKISEVERAGVDTGRGFYNGLHSQRSRIINLANDIATSVLTTMQRALDINSPSGETAWIADMTIQGLYDNLKAGISRIKGVSNEVAGAMLFDPQTSDLGFTYGQVTSGQPSMTEVMLDEVTQLLRQLRDKDDALYMDGYELARRGTPYINQENEIRISRNTRLKGGNAYA